MKTQEQIDVECRMISDMNHFKKSLSDSPVSYASHYNFRVGYYYGFYVAKNLNLDLGFLADFEKYYAQPPQS